MGLLGPIILILLSAVDRFRNQFPMRNPIPLGLEEYINHFTILIDGSPQVMLLTVDLHENFVNIEGITIASVLSLQPACINGAELDTPQADRFAADRYAPFS